MSYINDRVLDEGLTVLDTEANALHICTQEPTTYSEATVEGTYSCGSKSSPTITLTDGSSSGRAAAVAAITDGAVNCTGTVTAHSWALVDTVNSRLLATGSLASDQSVTDGNTFSLSAFDCVTIPDPS